MRGLPDAYAAGRMTDLLSAGLSHAITGGTVDTVVGSAGGTATLTYAAAGAGTAHVLGGVVWSYSAAPTGGSITVAQGTALGVYPQWDVTAAGAGWMPFEPPVRFPSNQQVVISGYPGGTAIVVKLNAIHWLEA